MRYHEEVRATRHFIDARLLDVDVANTGVEATPSGNRNASGRGYGLR